ncbi:GntR family transcriptional regulator [Arcanobacterium haemolyticum]|uniref:GntR family transcriptional regulator n=1 Tax=Arcanobacterium haemolyticum TaxID=28264 RepID=UPI000D9E37B6|nr:GntR family transcriptional regulator [Arcanobacterium haemolyticum]QCX46077.1 GntR family transcriptional regulator [Arcanobacterium haemolyticum]SPT75551.1 HTH-type transcriptional repressor yvoA [Arcanobacterium haemolyticum]
MIHQYQPRIELNRTSDTPLHVQISEPIERAITDGTLAAGTAIENEISMARRLNVSRPTARRAMQTLVEQGLLIRRRGKGTIVAPKPRHRIFKLTSLNEELRGQGKHPTTHILTYNVMPASHKMAHQLDCLEGAPILELERLRYRDGVPVAVLYNWMRADLAPSFADLEKRGLYELIRDSGITIASTTQSVSAERPSRRHAKLLTIPTRQPVLTINRTAFDEHGDIIEWGIHTYRGDLYTYESTVFAQGERG